MRWVLVVIIGMLLCISGCSGADGDGRESFGDKTEWSILQVQEYKYRGQATTPAFETVDGYELMSVPSLNGSRRIWVMLWPKSAPFYKQMSEGNYTLSKEFFEELTRDRKVSSTVEEVLRSHIEDESVQKNKKRN